VCKEASSNRREGSAPALFDSLSIKVCKDASSNRLEFTIDEVSPVLGSISPKQVKAGGEGFILLVRGRNFDAGSLVRWNGEVRETRLLPTGQSRATPQSHFCDQLNGEMQLLATIPASDIQQPGLASITVLTKNPGRTSNSAFCAVVNMSVKSAASLNANDPVANNSIAVADGANLAATTLPGIPINLPPLTLPQEVAGTRVEVIDSDGVGKRAGIHSVSPNQVMFQIPAASASGDATVEIRSASGHISCAQPLIEAVCPGLFSADGMGSGPALGEAAQVVNGALQAIGSLAQQPAPGGAFNHIPINRSQIGNPIFLILYGTGIGVSSSVDATIGGVGATGVSAPRPNPASLPDFIGMDRITIPIPQTVGNGVRQVTVRAGGMTSNVVTIEIV
jgi:uncharacterized protein (TIGR03437 family)